jgi:hypothetical protein
MTYIQELKRNLKEINYDDIQKEKEKEDLLCENMLRKTFLDILRTLQLKIRKSCVDNSGDFPIELITGLKNIYDLKEKYHVFNDKYRTYKMTTKNKDKEPFEILDEQIIL